MRIVEHSKTQFVDQEYIGQCKFCGGVFETSIPMIIGVNHDRYYRNTDRLKDLKVSVLGTMRCSCPICRHTTVKLKKK